MKKKTKNILIVAVLLIIIGLIGFNYFSVYQEKELTLNFDVPAGINTCQYLSPYINDPKPSNIILASQNEKLIIGKNEFTFKTNEVNGVVCLPYGSPNSGTNILVPSVNFNNKDFPFAISLSRGQNYWGCIGRYDYRAPEVKQELQNLYGNMLNDNSLYFADNQILIKSIVKDFSKSTSSYVDVGCLKFVIDIKPNSILKSDNLKAELKTGDSYTLISDMGDFGFLEADIIVIYKYLNIGTQNIIEETKEVINNKINIQIKTDREALVDITIKPKVTINYLSDTFVYFNANTLREKISILGTDIIIVNETEPPVPLVEKPVNYGFWILVSVVTILLIIWLFFRKKR